MVESSKRRIDDSLDHVSISSQGSEPNDDVEEFEFGGRVIEGELLELGLLNKTNELAFQLLQ